LSQNAETGRNSCVKARKTETSVFLPGDNNLRLQQKQKQVLMLMKNFFKKNIKKVLTLCSKLTIIILQRSNKLKQNDRKVLNF